MPAAAKASPSHCAPGIPALFTYTNFQVSNISAHSEWLLAQSSIHHYWNQFMLMYNVLKLRTYYFKQMKCNELKPD